jgi:hypothetical protein
MSRPATHELRAMIGRRRRLTIARDVTGAPRLDRDAPVVSDPETGRTDDSLLQLPTRRTFSNSAIALVWLMIAFNSDRRAVVSEFCACTTS